MTEQPPTRTPFDDDTPGFWSRFVRVLSRLFRRGMEPTGTGAEEPRSQSSSPYLPDSPEDRQAVSDGDEILRARAAFLDRQFEKNLRVPVTIERIRLDGVKFFDDGEWRLRPGFNLMLGRNGYGKSFLLRSAVALLKRDEETAQMLVDAMGGQQGRMRIDLQRWSSREPETIERDARSFVTDVGEVPILAIPDSRFTDRSVTSLQPPARQTVLVRDGALHFLRQLPYQGLVDEMLYEMCLDYIDAGKTFDLPVFTFLAGVVEELTGDQFAFDSIERTRVGFEIKVRTQNAQHPLPIQHASQGTLSMLAIFGLIRSFLKQVIEAGGVSDPQQDDIAGARAIIVIDEIDAHLHPVWQQRIRIMLTDRFPNVQFVVSAHSPLLVAGCGPGEVCVLRRQRPDSGRFLITAIERDFIGATSAELYASIFDIEDELDPTYLRYETMAKNRGAHDQELQRLLHRKSEGSISDRDLAQLETLIDTSRLMNRAEEVSKRRSSSQQQDMRILELEAEIERMQDRLPTTRSGKDGTDA